MARRSNENENSTGEIRLAPYSHIATDWDAHLKTEEYQKKRSRHIDYVLCSSRCCASAGSLTMEQIEEFFHRQLTCEAKVYDGRVFDCSYTNGCIPLTYYLSDRCPQIVRLNEFIMIPSDQRISIPDDRFERFNAEWHKRIGTSTDNYFRNSEIVPHCNGFAKWLKRWQDETDDGWEYRVLRISQIYLDTIRKNLPATSSQQNLVAQNACNNP